MRRDPDVIDRKTIEDLIFGEHSPRRFLQDSPILPDVWIAYGARPAARLDLLITPHRQTTAGKLSRRLQERLGEEVATQQWRGLHPSATESAGIAYNQSTVVAALTFDELIRVVLPATAWWRDNVARPATRARAKTIGDWIDKLSDEDSETKPHARRKSKVKSKGHASPSADVVWMFRLVGVIAFAQRLAHKTGPTEDVRSAASGEEELTQLLENADVRLKRAPSLVRALASDISTEENGSLEPLVYSVNRNREALLSVWSSAGAIKADAARALFKISCADLTWAVIDSGIDATHPAFRKRNASTDLTTKRTPRPTAKGSRIRATYDFTCVRQLLSISGPNEQQVPARVWNRLKALPPERREELRDCMGEGRDLPWELIAPLLAIPHDPKEGNYEAPENDHGTHVAGILAGDWPTADDGIEPTDMKGICPDLQLYDLRVLNRDGRGDEFAIITAVQFIRHLNAHKNLVILHGINLSFSIPHDVANYACGRTPICEECERVVDSGVVVVAAAGNQGYLEYVTPRGTIAGYSSVSITDPGNAQNVITVGATHRDRPHTYGVSYFSSRGPTGDGRQKPDLVAPGEKITAPILAGGVGRKDGTSMAAPHVSGAAALLMARHPELVGDPHRIKEVLCRTATDLGRERYFQGSGMVDILRAVQSI